MGITARSLELIRSVFLRDNQFPQPPEFINQYYSGYQKHGTISPLTSANSIYASSFSINNDIQSRYSDYELMGGYPEISTAINLFSDEATQADVITNKSVWIKSPDDTIQTILNNTLHKQLEIEDHIWEMAHDLTQFGNLFEEIVVRDQQGVVKLIHHPASSMRRIDGDNGVLYGFISDSQMNFEINTQTFTNLLKDPARNLNSNQSIKVFEPWEMAHFRIRGSGRQEQYGISAVDAARWAWKRLSWMEDAMVLYKLTRSASRYVFYIDVGDVPPNEARKILNQYKQDFKKQKYTDENGRLTFKWSPLSADEDFYIARRKGERSTEIETLNGIIGQDTDDTVYFRDKLISALGVPKAYLSYDETVGRANMGQQDIRFSKSVMRIQRGIKQGIKHITQVDLAARNIDPDKVEYEVMMQIPSGALEIAHIEVLNSKADLAQKFQGLNFSEYYIQSKILGMSDDEIADEMLARTESEAKTNTNNTQSLPPEAAPENPEEPPQESIARYIMKQKDAISLKEKNQVNRILDMIESKDDNLSRRVKELRGLTKEIQHCLNQSKK
jgi:hypothetical protein